MDDIYETFFLFALSWETYWLHIGLGVPSEQLMDLYSQDTYLATWLEKISSSKSDTFVTIPKYPWLSLRGVESGKHELDENKSCNNAGLSVAASSLQRPGEF